MVKCGTSYCLFNFAWPRGCGRTHSPQYRSAPVLPPTVGFFELGEDSQWRDGLILVTDANRAAGGIARK